MNLQRRLVETIFLRKQQCQGDEVLDAEAFGAEFEDGVGEEAGGLLRSPAFAGCLVGDEHKHPLKCVVTM